MTSVSYEDVSKFAVEYPKDGSTSCVIAPPEGAVNLAVYITDEGSWSNTDKKFIVTGYTYVYEGGEESSISWYSNRQEMVYYGNS